MIGVAGGHDDDAVGHAGIKLRESEREHAAHAGALDGMEFLDAEMAQERSLRADHVVDGDDRKVRGVRLARGGIDGARPGGSFATAKDVRADDEKAVGIKRLAGADHEIPPTGAAILVDAGDVGIAAERMEDENRVGLFGVERAPRLVGEGVGRNRAAAIKGERLGDGVE